MSTSAKAQTSGVEEYIEAIWRVAGDGPAATKTLAAHLHVAPASVTGMLRRLSSLGLIVYRPYGKASLTATGRQLALQVIRRHRLSERLLTDILGLPWEKAHAEACKFEHLITGEVETRLKALLGSVETCPHGHRLDLARPAGSMPLTAIKPPQLVQIVAVADESEVMIHYLSDLGLVPGAEITVTGHEPTDEGAILLEIAGQPRALGRRVAEQITVKKGTDTFLTRKQGKSQAGKQVKGRQTAKKVSVPFLT
jgi:DtxR family transcriptional regulator, Mn-dependent transcriptional regulator